MADAITLKKNADGVLLKNDDGILVKECSGGDPCEFCDGTTPAAFEVVFSDVTGCCVPGVFGTRNALHTSLAAAALNNAAGFTLTQDGADTCSWSLTTIHVGYSNYYELYDCDTWLSNSYTAWLVITLTKTSDSTWTLTVEFQTTLVAYSDYMFYTGITAQPAGCTGGLSFTNEQLSCPNNAGYDGSASVSVP